MSLLEALKLALASILSSKLRSFLTLLGLIFGVATVIVVVSLVEGFNAYVDEKIANIGTNAFSVQKYSIEDYSSLEALNSARRRNRDITREDLEAVKSIGGSVADTGGKAMAKADIKLSAQTPRNSEIKGNTPNIAVIEKIETGLRRWFLNVDEESRRYVCIIGSETAEKLFPRNSP